MRNRPISRRKTVPDCAACHERISGEPIRECGRCGVWYHERCARRRSRCGAKSCEAPFPDELGGPDVREVEGEILLSQGELLQQLGICAAITLMFGGGALYQLAHEGELVSGRKLELGGFFYLACLIAVVFSIPALKALAGLLGGEYEE